MYGIFKVQMPLSPSSGVGCSTRSEKISSTGWNKKLLAHVCEDHKTHAEKTTNFDRIGSLFHTCDAAKLERCSQLQPLLHAKWPCRTWQI